MMFLLLLLCVYATTRLMRHQHARICLYNFRKKQHKKERSKEREKKDEKWKSNISFLLGYSLCVLHYFSLSLSLLLLLSHHALTFFYHIKFRHLLIWSKFRWDAPARNRTTRWVNARWIIIVGATNGDK